MTKVLQRERITAEQLIENLKEEQQELNDELIKTKELLADHKSYIHLLKNDIHTLSAKKESLEKELKSLLNTANNDYSSIEEIKLKTEQEIINDRRIIDELNETIAGLKNEVRILKLEKTNVETEKEEVAAKIAELIALEKNLKFKIDEYEKFSENNKDFSEE